MHKTTLTLIAAAVVVAIGSHAGAAVVATISGQSAEGTFSVSATDLVNSDQATFDSLAASNPTAFGDQNIAFANNGAKDYSIGSNTTDGSFGSVDGGTYTFTLNTTLNPLGYDITSIAVLSGYDGRRVSHNYTISYSVVGDASFTDLVRVPATGINEDDNVSGTRFEVRTLVTEDTTGILATGVDQIRFTFRNDSDSGSVGPQTVYREIDVFGSAVVIIPAPAALPAGLGLMMIGVLRRRRK